MEYSRGYLFDKSTAQPSGDSVTPPQSDSSLSGESDSVVGVGGGEEEMVKETGTVRDDNAGQRISADGCGGTPKSMLGFEGC
jgi:hypothetical protein